MFKDKGFCKAGRMLRCCNRSIGMYVPSSFLSSDILELLWATSLILAIYRFPRRPRRCIGGFINLRQKKARMKSPIVRGFALFWKQDFACKKMLLVWQLELSLCLWIKLGSVGLASRETFSDCATSITVFSWVLVVKGFSYSLKAVTGSKTSPAPREHPVALTKKPYLVSGLYSWKRT